MRTLTITLMTLWVLASTSLTVLGECSINPKFSYRTKGLTVDFVNKTQAAFSQVLWNFGDGNTSADLNAKHTYTEAGMYVFSLTVMNDVCSETFEGKVYVFNAQKTQTPLPSPALNNQADIAAPIAQADNKGISSEVKATNDFNKNVYADAQKTIIGTNLVTNLSNAPNPFEVQTTISFDLASAAEVSVNVFDLNGRVVDSLLDGEVAEGRQDINFMRGTLPAGTYIVNVNVNRRNYVRRIAVI